LCGRVGCAWVPSGPQILYGSARACQLLEPTRRDRWVTLLDRLVPRTPPRGVSLIDARLKTSVRFRRDAATQLVLPNSPIRAVLDPSGRFVGKRLKAMLCQRPDQLVVCGLVDLERRPARSALIPASRLPARNRLFSTARGGTHQGRGTAPPASVYGMPRRKKSARETVRGSPIPPPTPGSAGR
jgi:hypothetical protein